MLGPPWRGLNCGRAAFLGSDADGLLHVEYEHFSVANLAGFRGTDDGGDRHIQNLVADDNVDFNLREEINGVFGAAIHVGMALLPAEAFDFRDRHALNADVRQSGFDFLEFERFDYRFDFLHDCQYRRCWRTAALAAHWRLEEIVIRFSGLSNSWRTQVCSTIRPRGRETARLCPHSDWLGPAPGLARLVDMPSPHSPATNNWHNRFATAFVSA